MSIPSRHPEVAEPQPNRPMQDLECYPAFGSSGSIHRGDEGSPLTPTLSRRARGKKAAFTLAEVLITLAIIGVVASMTIPTLVQNYKKKVVETKLLRVYSLMNQAIKLSTIDNGPTNTWRTLGYTSATTASYDDVLEWYNEYLSPYLKTQKVEKDPDSECLIAYFIDGSALVISNTIYDMWYYVYAKDVNNPDVVKGVNSFRFRFSPVILAEYPDRPHYKYVKNPGFATYAFAWDGTFDGAKYSTIESPYGCYEYYASLCSKLIELNGWKIPDDYPYKF